MQKCPKCHSVERENRAGQTRAGSQRDRCMMCGAKYTPAKKHHGYGANVRRQAVWLYVDGMNFRRIARHLGLQHSTVSIWVKEYVSHLPEAPQPKKVKTAEMDELFTFIGSKKTKST